ncbi:uncharacterized protein JCM6883_005766 [Sporobolomyces salmoneus]|uniref:uncharacterized protein n=1 Tax=Sporobolomyces salmoneus TaxID=183962 RepID=UPI0031731701
MVSSDNCDSSAHAPESLPQSHNVGSTPLKLDLPASPLPPAAAAYELAGLTGEFSRIGVVRVVGPIAQAFTEAGLSYSTTFGSPEPIYEGDLYYFILMDPTFAEQLPDPAGTEYEYLKEYWKGIALLPCHITHHGTVRMLKSLFGEESFLELGGFDALDEDGINEIKEYIIVAAAHEGEDPGIGVSLSSEGKARNHRAYFDDLINFLITYVKSPDLAATLETLTEEEFAQVCAKWVQDQNISEEEEDSEDSE